MSALALTYNAGAEQRLVRAAQEGRQWLVVDEFGDDRRTVESDIREEGEAVAIARDYAQHAMAAGHPLVSSLADDDGDA
jgi:hypothetical protein